jgi:hypothetical protein
VDSLQRQLKSSQAEVREISVELESLRDRSVDDDGQRESARREAQQVPLLPKVTSICYYKYL